ncbi:MAG: hsp70 family protein [Myxococcaceae bacterium]|nr:hsp70 family protein [Myxococcaceae bacterium]
MAADVRYAVGIDLGTSNCAVAFVEPGAGAKAQVVDFPVMQAVRPFEVATRPLLPSCIYLPAEEELAADSAKLPWETPSFVVGELARWHGAKVPGRCITSAKSWLCHPGVDRQAPILPWGSQSTERHLSPVAASQALLSHIRHAWDSTHPEAPLATQEVVLTVPASFDEGARALTLQAARDAGLNLDKLLLLEEPAAAFYDFTARYRASLAYALEGVRLLLVVDVGGGTTDFSLVQVAMLPEGPSLKRLAVGDHLLLGGDNMDAALAHPLEARLAPASGRFTSEQWAQALNGARAAKEALLATKPQERSTVTVSSTGSKLLGNTLSAELTRAEVEHIVVQGFFPKVAASAAPRVAKGGAIVELGLPFAKDAAITHHLVSFLRGHATAGFAALGMAEKNDELPRPDAILLNGGVFNSPALQKAIVDAVSALWPQQAPVRLLAHDSLDLAVARGAAYSALARRALGQRIGGGAPRAYYVAVTQDSPPQGVCLIPRGLDETETVELKDRPFELMLGKPVQLQLYSTTADRLDKPGDIVTLDDSFKALPPLHTVLDGTKGTLAKVRLSAVLSEVGTLALSALTEERRWRLEFELRGTAKSSGAQLTESMPTKFSDAVLAVERVFGNKPLPVTPKDVKQLPRILEQSLGPREKWRLPVLRELWTALFSGASKRRRSADHERIFFHLLGYALRPGVGYPLDAWRAEQTFSLFKDAVQHHGEQASWAEFWILWRRIAGGLNEAAQTQLWSYLKPHLERRVPAKPPALEKLKGVMPQALDEMVRTAASLELLAPAHKTLLGGWVLERLRDTGTPGGPWTWALGRLGARQPIHGAAHRVVPAETAQQWVALLLEPAIAHTDGAPFALAQLARMTGDRSRDIDEATRQKVLAFFAQTNAPESFRKMVQEAVVLSVADENRALGDALPLGLSLA